MQSSAPELMDLGSESAATLESYGAMPGKASFANNCLLARRLVERDVMRVFMQARHASERNRKAPEPITKNRKKKVLTGQLTKATLSCQVGGGIDPNRSHTKQG